MKKFLPIILACLCWAGISNAQLDAVVVSEFVHDGSIPQTTGMTTYRMFAQTQNATDFVTEVTGDVTHPLNISSSTSFYRNNVFAPGITGKDINAGLVGIPGFEDLRYVSFVSIGFVLSNAVGIPYAEDASGEMATASTANINTVGAGIASLATGDDIVIDSPTGAAWFGLNGDPNGFGVGVDNSVCLGQFTTDGEFTFNINTTILNNDGDAPVAHLYKWDLNPGLGLTFPFVTPEGCTDTSACNFDPVAVIDDGSCAVNDNCGVCDGDDSTCTGCTDSTACDYDSTATIAGDCDFSCLGCTDSTACNYDSTSTIDDGSCIIVNAGSISTGGASTTTCAGDGIEDIITVLGNAAQGTNVAYIATDADGNILATQASNEFDFEGAGPGVCLLWRIAYEDGVDLGVANAADLTGCFDLSNSISVTREEGGCMDSTAENYNPNAVCGSADLCEFAAIDGCTDSTACNYDSLATNDDGSCLTEDCNGDCGGTAVLDNCGVCGGDDSSCSGCTDAGACNFDSTATIDDSSCEFDSCAGCTDASACNFDSTATIDDGSCGEDDCLGVCNGTATEGCTDSTAVNFDPTADCDDSSCIDAGVPGCTDVAACNFDSLATVDDGSCLEADCNGECGGTAVLDDCDVCGGDNSSCSGCTDSTAVNFDSTATIEDGSCAYAPENDLCPDALVIECGETLIGSTINSSVDDAPFCAANSGNGAGVWYTITGTGTEMTLSTCNENTDYDSQLSIYSGGCDDLQCVTGNDDEPGDESPQGCSTVSFDSNLGEVYLVLVHGFPGGFFGDETGTYDFTINCEGAIEGCTDSTACNFDSTANVDDGSCTVEDCLGECGGDATEGCTDSNALNYDSTADCNDESCEYDTDCVYNCPEDVIVECGSDISPEELGYPYFTGECQFFGLNIDFSDEIISEDDCITVIERTFSEFQEFECVQKITIVDSEGPVFPEVEPITVECMEEVPAPMTLTAIDACSGIEYDSESLVSGTGEVIETCELSVAYGPGDDWAIWLEGFSQGDSDDFVWDENGGTLDIMNDGTAHLYGTVVNTVNSNQGFIVDLWFENGQDWTDWMNAGRWYKDDLGFGADHFQDWMYFEMSAVSTLTGTGEFDGDILSLNHRPDDFFFGFQCGVGANNKNGNEGFSGWFDFEGNVNGEYVSGNGDVNVDKSCEPGLPLDCPNETEVTHIYRATDDCGNTTILTHVITVDDNTAPVFVDPPADLVLSCEDAIPPMEDCIATDNCTGTITYIGPLETITPGVCDNEQVITRSWGAIDECGNTVSHLQTITIEDNTPPVITCPADISHECDETPDYGVATATDNCGEPTISVEETISGDSCESYITRVYTATDACGNEASCTQTITITDTEAPEFGDFDPYVHVECDMVDTVEEAITATDNCNEVTITYTDVLNSGGCMGVLQREYTATDACGNSTSITQYISIQDTTAPEMECPEDATYECDEVVPEAEILEATDNCGLEVEVVLDETEEGDECFLVITRTWTATDYCGNVTTCSQTITVQDTTNPVLDMPADITHECDETPDYGMATATDNCDLEVSVELEETITEGDCPQEMVIERIYRAFDNCGNSAIGVQTITIQDTTAPELSIPEDVSHECDESPEYGVATATDNCDLDVAITYEDAVSGDDCATTILRTWTATDDCGNSTSDVQTISWSDTTAPVITCPADMTHECDENPDYGFATATDNCQEPTVTVEETVSGDSCETVISRMFTATDGCGNSTSCVQTITIVDTTAPVIMGEVNISQPCDAIDLNLTLDITDNCNEFTVTHTDVMVSGGCAGQIIRTCVATDACGNVSDEFVQIIDLYDDVAPEIACAEDFTIECDEEVPAAQEPTYSDNCGDVFLTLEETEAGDSCLSTITRTWTAEDECGNQSTCSQVITIVDTTSPTIEAAADATVECGDDLPAPAATTADNCNEVTWSVTAEIAETCGDTFVMTRTYTATDACGNISETDEQVITVIDTTAPVIECPADLTHECDEAPDYGVATATDTCGDVTLSSSDVVTGDSCETTITRTWTATDACDNTASCTQVITIVDTTAPVISGPAEMTAPCDFTDIDLEITVTDNCNDWTLTHNDVPVSGGCAGQIIRTCTATDACGNVSEPFTQIIDLVDEVAPEISCAADATYECDEDVPSAQEPEYSDNCTDVTLSLEETVEGDACFTTITRTWTATDACNNSASCTQTITVVDTTAPVITCPDDISHSCDESPAYGFATATDNCQDPSVTVEETTTGDACGMTITRVFTATDGCGNSSTCTQTITIFDEEAPVITCPADMTHECDEAPDYGFATATDNCQDPSVSVEETTTGDSCETTITRVFTATDGCGNSSTCTQVITILDTTAPVITGPAEMTAPCDFTDIDLDITVTDNCNDWTLTHNDVAVSGGCAGQIIRTCVATDACGNVSDEFVQIIDLVDEVAPEISCAADATYECDEDVPSAQEPEYSDNCTEVTLTLDETVEGDACFTTITRTWTATDECNNSSSCTQVITVVDTTAPVITCPDDMSHSCDESPVYGFATATDNCQDPSVTLEETATGDACGMTITRVFTATDGCGNSSTCTQTITIFDEEAPVITCPGDISHECDEAPDYGFATATDNCQDPTVTVEETTTGDACETVITRVFTATDGCGNSTSCTQVITIVDTTAPNFVDFPSDASYQCYGDVPAHVDPAGVDNCQVADVVCTTVEDIDECGNGTITTTCTVSDGCGNANTSSYTVTVNDTTAPELTELPSDLVLDCEDSVPSAPEVGAVDNCDNDPIVIFEEELVGDLPEEGSIADCTLSTPAGELCHPYEDWALRLFDFPGYEFYSTVSASFVEYEDGTAHLTGTVQDNSNPGSGFTIDVWFENGMSWDDWSTQGFPTSFKDDCETAEDSGVYEDWTYYLMTPGQATLTGYGSLAGSFFDLVHAPINNYYGYQVGVGANNVNENYGNGGWFTASGQLVVDGGEPVEVSNFQGDFAFDADCCPQYEVIRTWYTMDCSGNTSDVHTQTISFEDQGEDEVPTQEVDASFGEVEGDLYISNIFPNPVRGTAQIQFQVAKTSVVRLDVLDMNGNLVETIYAGNAEQGVTYTEFLKTAGIESGVYMVRLSSNIASVHERVVVAK